MADIQILEKSVRTAFILSWSPAPSLICLLAGACNGKTLAKALYIIMLTNTHKP